MNAQAGPSRSLPSRTIDLASIPLDKSRITSSLSSSSIAPSLCTHRSSTQSTEGWGGLHTPRSERMSLCISECSITEEDVVVIGPGSVKDQADTPIDSVILEDAQIVGLWLDLDKTPKPSDPIFHAPKFPSRISSLPKQQPFLIPPQQRSIRFHDPSEQRSKPLPTSTRARLDKPLPLLISSPIHTDKALPPAPTLYEIDEPPPALPDDSPLIPSCMLERYVPPLNLIPPFDPDAARKRLALSTMREELSRIPVPRPTSTSDRQPNATEVVVIAGPPPPIPPRRSSRKERSGQSIPTDQKMVSSTSLASLGGSTDKMASSTSSLSLGQASDKRSSSTSSVSLEPAADIRATSSTSLVSLGQAPPLPPPRASSLRSASARAAIAASDSKAVIVIPGPAKETRPTIEPLQSPLSRRPRVRSRSAQLPPPTTMTASTRDRQHSSSHISLSSILEDEGLPDMEATPDGSWSLRRNRLRLARAKSQPRLRTGDECGPWRTMREMRSHCVSLELV